MTIYTGKYARETMFPKWCNLVKGRQAKAWNDVGAYRIDYNPIYGGCQIERIVSDGGAITTVIGRMTPREFTYFVWGLESSLTELHYNDPVLVS